MATAEVDTGVISSALESILEQWWCPECSCQTENVPPCGNCEEMLKILAQDFLEGDQLKAMQAIYKRLEKTKRLDDIEEEDDVLISEPKRDKDEPIAPERLEHNVTVQLTARDRRHKHEADADELFKKIIRDCKERRTPFVDKYFPPNEESIGRGSFRQVSQWLRISDVATSSHDDRKLPWTVFSSPEPSDIQQGALGNCWLVAVLALIAEQPRLLEHILLTKQFNNEGVYLVRICHNGLWKTVILDDRFPCTSHKQLVFTQAKRRQMYIPLIEKACAKLFGSYAALISGNMREGLQLLTGAPCDYIDLQPTDNSIDGDFIWTRLITACESKLLIGTSTGGTDVSPQEYDRVHIHNNHAFSILAAHVLSREKSRFVLVRDPHSRSNYSEEAVTGPVLAQLQLINPARRSTGAFWISWKKFLRYFSSITISTYNSNHYDIREQSKFTQSSTEYITTYSFYLSKGAEIIISLLHHRDARKMRSSHTQSFVLCDTNELKSHGTVGKHTGILVSRRGGFTYWEGFLSAGHYTLVPFSTAYWQKSNSDERFTVVMQSLTELNLVCRKRPATFLTDCIISAARKSFNQKKDRDMVMYSSPKRSHLKILLVENRSSTDYLNFKVRITSAKNLCHSRHIGSPKDTHDCIPPRYCQVIFATEWLDMQGSSAHFEYSISYSQGRRETASIPPIKTDRKDFHSPRAF